MIASYGIVSLWREKVRGQRYIRGGIVICVALLVILPLTSIDIGSTERSFEEGIVPYTSSYSPRGEDYIHYEAASEILSFMNTLPIQRFFSESSVVGDLGTPHYFMTMGPLKNNQASLFGVFVESSPQAPFIMPTFEGVLGGMLDWGDNRISEKISSFLKQPQEVFVERLGYFGVSHVIATTQGFKDRLAEVEGVSVATSTPYYNVYALEEYKPLMYASEYKPGVYMNLDGTLPFRDVALALFEHPDTYRLPVIEWDRDLSELEAVSDAFSFLVVSADGISQDEKELLENISLPLIVLNPRERIDHPQRYNIYDFEPLSYNIYYPPVPDASFAWKQFQKQVLELIERRDVSEVSVERIDNETISFLGNGPVIINAGYFPYWLVTSECHSLLSCSVFQVTPSQMLVFSEGKTTLSYQSPYGWWGIVSLLALLFLFWGLWYVRK